MSDFTDGSVPFFPRGVRMHEDRIRGIKVLLAPERALKLDMTGAAILGEVNGSRSFEEIVTILAGRYNAPADQIGKDARAFLSGLIDRRMMEVRV